ncbi:MAG: efflux RND transporter periplasmic adaptor subunit [Chloroflexota bacterium]|nr:efflux RND transporter periplasmic adaptor subunit [Chloroflexota bacterium]
MKKKILVLTLSVLVLLSLSSCDILASNDDENGAITGSGHISARQIGVASELGGKVIEVLVEEGDAVQTGDVLFRLDDEIYQAQSDQAAAAVGVAEAAVAGANAQLDAAKIQSDLAVQGARFQDQAGRNAAWLVPLPDEFDLPVWYFEKGEEIKAAQAEVDAAKTELEQKLADLEAEIQDASNSDLVAAEESLAEVRTTYLIAKQTYDQAVEANSSETLESIAREQFDTAVADLERAQLEYDRILSTTASDDVLDARGQVAIARARYENASDRLDQMMTGDESLQVEAAAAAVKQAETGVAQAQANLAQAKAALKLLEVQIEKTNVYAPSSGVVLERNLEPGETMAAGSPVIVIGQLEAVEVTVYIAEDRYGQVKLGQEVEITVDSYPGETFAGSVVHISDDAEFTPRNVQTVDGRKSTVYAIDIQVPNPDAKLKPGMPADVVVDVES